MREQFQSPCVIQKKIMANWKLFEPKGGILRWREKNDFLINNGEDFVCYSFHPIQINLDAVVGEVEIIGYEDYKRECPNLRYVGS